MASNLLTAGDVAEQLRIKKYTVYEIMSLRAASPKLDPQFGFIPRFGADSSPRGASPGRERWLIRGHQAV
ncbi:MAG: hypothetical protein LBB83_07060, partial [Treponema sp.]|nr:hypothetical protein [Treponema sp.]